MVKLDYEVDGIKRRVLVRHSEDNPDYGIPVDVYDNLEAYYRDRVPRDVFLKLWEGLWSRGYIEPSDFIKPRANMDIRSALQTSLAIEINEIKRIAGEK